MKAYTLVFVALAAVLLYTDCVSAKEVCPQENCLPPEQCEQQVEGPVQCSAQGTSCCSVVKQEFQTRCRHFGGVCMNQCTDSLQRNAVDCSGQVCCVLV